MTAVPSNTLFAEPVTQVQAADLHVVGATDAADAATRSVPQLTTVAGQTFGENDSIAVASTVTIDGRELTAGLWYWPVATAAADVNALVGLGAGTVTGPYIRPADGATLEVGKRYIASTGTLNTPPTPDDGDWFYLRNDSDAVTGGGVLDRVTIIGPIRTSEGQDLPGFPVAPGLEYLATYGATAGRWTAANWSPIIAVLDSTHNGQALRGHAIYEIKGDAAGMSFPLPPVPAGHIDIRLQAGSTFPVTIEQANTGGTDQFRFENATSGTSFVLDVAHAGQHVSITGEPFTDCWFTYRDWEIANINKNSAPWQANHAYTVGELVTENRLSDGKLTIFAWDDSAANGGTPTDGTSGATWDAAEEARWIEIGEAAVDIEILQSVEITVTGYLSSWNTTDDVVLIDAAGNDYDSVTDWRVSADSEGLLFSGTYLGGNDISPTPANGTRTVTLVYAGSTTRRGLSAVRATDGHTGSTSAITRVKTKYFSGVTELFDRTGGLTGVNTIALPTAFDFLTDPMPPGDPNIQYMTAASGLFWYSRDNFRPNEVFTLVTDADNHQLTIGNNSGLEGLKVIDTDGTVTETVNPALQGSTNSVDLDPLSIYHTWVDDGPVLHVRKVGGAAGGEATIIANGTIEEILALEVEPGKTYLDWITEDTQHGLLWKNPDAGVDDARIQAATTAAGSATPFVTLTELAELSFPLIAARSLAQYSLYRVHAFGASTIGFTEQAAASAALADETSVAEYKVEWGGAAGGSNASSSSPYYSPDDIITLDKDGDYTFDVLPYQKTFSQENGTATGGIFYLKTSTGSTIETLTFPWKKRDSNESFFPYEGGRQTIHRANMTAGTYRLSFTSHAGAGGGNRVSYEGYAHVIARRSSLASGDPGADGPPGTSIDHISRTAGDGSPGTTDTYTAWGDAGESINMGTFDVPIPAAPGAPLIVQTTIPASSNATVNWPAFQVPQDGNYWFKFFGRGRNTQGTRISYNIELRTATNGGGAQLGSAYANLILNLSADNGTYYLPAVAFLANGLTAGTDYFLYGDRNTGGVTAGEIWSCEVVKV